MSTCKSIGTRNESSLHRTLKYQYAGPGGKTEAETGEYIADGKRLDGEYIEIQTGSFAPLKKKVKYLAAGGKVRIIHPVAVTKIIEVYKPAGSRSKKQYGALLYRRKSPLKGSIWNIFNALLHATEIPLIKRITIEVILVDIIEKRIKDGKGAWRRKGISIKDRQLTAIHENIILKKTADYLRFVPFKKGEEFTSSTLAERAGIDTDMARKALYVLTKLKVVARKGKKRNSWLYIRNR